MRKKKKNKKEYVVNDRSRNRDKSYNVPHSKQKIFKE